MKVRAHRPEDAARWDAHVARCPKGTVLHTRRFLAYHGARFEDASLIVQDGERWLAALPAARLLARKAGPGCPRKASQPGGRKYGYRLLARTHQAEL